jgi:hypothetical protein
VLPDSKLDPILTVTDPAGATSEVDVTGAGTQEFAVLGNVRGRYRITVTGFQQSTGGFTIEAKGVQDSLVLGEPTVGRIEDAADEAEFVFDLPASGTYVVEVHPDADLDAMLQVSDQFGDSKEVDNAHAGMPEFRVIRGGTGRYVATVSGYDTTTGDFELVVSAVDVVPLARGTVSGSGTAAYTTAFAGEELGEIRVVPDAGDIVEIHVIDSAGDPIDAARSAETGDTASVLLSDAMAFDAQVVVLTDGQYDVTFEPITTRPITSGESVTATGTSGYEITGDNDVVELRVEPDATGSVHIRAFDADGYVLEDAESQQAGDPASIVLARDLADGARVVARSDGPYTVTLATIPIQPLVPGDVVRATGTTVYDVGGSPGQALEVRVEPASADGTVAIQPFDSSGYRLDGDGSAQPGDAASVVLTEDLADDMDMLVTSDGAYTVSVVAVAVQPPPPDGTVSASGTTAYGFTVDTDTVLEFSAAPGPNGFVDVRVMDVSGYVIDAAESASAGEPVSVLIDGAFSPSQLVVVIATGDHADSVAPTP